MTMRKARLNPVLRLLLVLPVAAGAAEEMRFSVHAGIGTSDNVAHVVGGGERVSIISLGTDFAVQHQTRRMDANLLGNLAWLDYSGREFDSEVQGRAAGAMRIAIMDDRLSWSVEDSFGQTPKDSLQARTPDNQENINSFSTGPNLLWRLGANTYVQGNARYGRFDYMDSPFDSQRLGGYLGLQRRVSSRASLTLGVSTQKIEPIGSSLGFTYDTEEATAGYELTGAQNTLRLQVGVSRVQGGGLNDSGGLFRLGLERRVGERSTLTLRAARERTDAGASLGSGRFGEQMPVAAAPDAYNLSREIEPYLNDSVALGWNIRGRVTTLRLDATWSMEDSLGSSDTKRSQHNLSATARRQLGPRLTGGLRLRHSDQDIRGRGGLTENLVSLSLNWQAGRNLSLETSGDLSRYHRQGEPGNARESRFWLRLRYGREPSS